MGADFESLITVLHEKAEISAVKMVGRWKDGLQSLEILRISFGIGILCVMEYRPTAVYVGPGDVVSCVTRTVMYNTPV